MNLLLIKDYCEKKQKALKNLAAECGISEQTLHRCIRENKMQAGDLEKIALSLQVDISSFFDNTETSGSVSIGHQVNGNGNSVSGDITLAECKRELNHLKQLLEEKERLIQVLLNKIT